MGNQIEQNNTTLSRKSFLNIYIVKVLKKYSSINSLMTPSQIAEKVNSLYGLEASVNTVRRSLRTMKQCEYGVMYYEKQGAYYDADEDYETLPGIAVNISGGMDQPRFYGTKIC